MEACTQSYIQLSGGGLTNHHKSLSGWEHQGWCEHTSEINQRDKSLLLNKFVQFSHYVYNVILFGCSVTEHYGDQIWSKASYCYNMQHWF